MNSSHFAVGDIVVNLTSQIASVVAIHSTGDPILKAVDRKLKAWGGKWIADVSKTRKLTTAELAQFVNGGTEIVR